MNRSRGFSAMSDFQHQSVRKSPNLNDLLQRYLQDPAAHARHALPAVGDVEPHDIAGGFLIPVQTLWSEALAVFPLLAGTTPRLAIPPEWAGLALLPCPSPAVPCAAGIIPQRVREFARLQPESFRLDGSSVPPPPVPGFAGLRKWLAEIGPAGQVPEALLAAGIAAELGESTQAGSILARIEPAPDSAFRTAWLNQQAALLWLQHQPADALAILSSLSDSGPILFNRALAYLSLGHDDLARTSLQAAIPLLPESSGWSHLARLIAAVIAS